MGNCLIQKKKHKISELQTISENYDLILNNYSKFLGNQNKNMDEPVIGVCNIIRPSKSRIEKYFEIEPSIIGQGQFGKIQLARLKSCPAHIFAIKIVNKQDLKNQIMSVKREVKLLNQCDHPNIIKFYELFESSRKYYFQMEYCNGKSLQHVLDFKGRIEEKQLKVIFRQVLLAINHMHLRGICHRDIKPENFIFKSMYDNASLKLLDFGFAKKFFGQNGKSRMYNVIGTPLFVAPEVLSGDYDEKCDIWSAGILLYRMASGAFPYNMADSMKGLFKQIISLNIDFDSCFGRLDLSPEFFDLLKKLLCSEKKRISINQAHSHNWFNEKYFDKLESFQIKELITNFFHFSKYTPFQKNIFKVYVKYLSKFEVKSPQTLFFMIDRDLDGIISFPELKFFLIQNKLFTSNEDCLVQIESLHKTDNHHIFYTEFIAATVSKAFIHSKQELKNLFENIKLMSEEHLCYKTIENIYYLAGYTFCVDAFEDLLKKSGILLKKRKAISFENFEKLMTQDLESITSDEEEFKSVLQNEINSKKIKNDWNEQAIRI